MPRTGRVSDSVAGGVTYCYPMRRVAGLGERGNGGIDGQRARGRGQAGRAHAHFVDGHAFNASQGLAGAANAGAAVHSVDLQCEFRHVYFSS